MLTPETLPRHELTGLPVRVADATHDGYVGIAGRVVEETERTLLVESGDAGGADAAAPRAASGTSGASVRQVPKAAATFEFRLPDDASDDASARHGGAREADQFVTVAGERLVARPARRTEHRGDSIWR
ncbi:ribonuclease P protein component 1 [Haloglomus litoreum]|uniref:ribonuclease P protein component 1 n=1 Tax=Haloglomus litoreum TaxID=3034026 RepID=UPI003B21EC54